MGRGGQLAGRRYATTGALGAVDRSTAFQRHGRGRARPCPDAASPGARLSRATSPGAVGAAAPAAPGRAPRGHSWHGRDGPGQRGTAGADRLCCDRLEPQRARCHAGRAGGRRCGGWSGCWRRPISWSTCCR
jgi:hypothetical protein